MDAKETTVRTKAANEKFCSECGEIINTKAEICPKCGVRQADVKADGEKNRVVAALLALFLGGFGIHRMYLGKVVSGVIFLLFCWTFIPAIIGFFEALILFSMSDKKFYESLNSKHQSGKFSIF